MNNSSNFSLLFSAITCSPVLYIAPGDVANVTERLSDFAREYLEGEKSYENITNVILNSTDSNTSNVFVRSHIELDISDTRSEKIHTFDSAALLLIMALLFLTVITIWVFKARRFRVFHETGLSLIYGIVVGLILKFVLPPNDTPMFDLVCEGDCNSRCAGIDQFEVGEDIQLRLGNNNSVVNAEVLSKVFQDNEGNYIEQTLLFNPELFFFALLPPIIFQAGFSLQKRHFFRNLGSLLLYAFVGTTVSTAIIGSLMYGYTLTNFEGVNTTVANATHYPIPEEFKDSMIPSLLFGSLISATDPVTVLAIFHDLHVDHDLYSLVFGESVMNDAVAIVLFRSIDEYSPAEGSGDFEVAAVFRSIGIFVGIFIGSFVLGTAMGLMTALLMKFSNLRDYPLLETSMFFIMSYSTFLFAEFAGLTGIVAVLFCGIMQSYYTFINLSEESRRRTKDLFELINFLAENFVFSYMGLSLFTYKNHQWVPGFITFSFVAIFAGRVVNIYILSFILNLGRAKRIKFRFQHMLVFAGLRGAIAFALAIRNTQSEARQLIFTTTLMIVMGTVLVCGGFTTLALQCLRIKVGVEEDPQMPHCDGHEIPYNPKSGNWFIAKWSKFDKSYLIPLFTHYGRSVGEFLPQFCVPLCKYCVPADLRRKEDVSLLDEEIEEEESEEEEEPTTLSFRHGREGDEEDGPEGDLGLGTDKRGYLKLEGSEESRF